MNDKILKLFSRAIPTDLPVSHENIFKASAKLGYLVHPDVCQVDVLQWLNSQQYNPNSTFYKSWEDVVSKNRMELLIDQLIHYFSTYGTDYTATPYIPNGSPAVVDFNSYKVILPIASSEVISRCERMLYSGIALQQETIEDIVGILNGLGYEADITRIKNREALMLFCDRYNKLPAEPMEMVRYLVYKATGSTLLIKSKEVIETIAGKQWYIGNIVAQFGYEKLAAVFYRYKPIFLAFRRNCEPNRRVINQLRKLATKYHQPAVKPFVETVLAQSHHKASLAEKIDRLNNFKKVLLLQTLRVRSRQLETRAFVIRNQKLWIKQGKQDQPIFTDWLFETIYESLVNSLRAKACRIALPAGVQLSLPTSEKSFIGNYPLGTSFDIAGRHTIVGINWREADGARDLDLSMVNVKGGKIGWNADYVNDKKSLVYSGDMTSADPEATELIYSNGGFTEGIVKVNLFNGAPKSKLRLFVAREKITNMQRNYMVDPNNILFTIEAEMDSQEKSFAVLSNDKLILAQFRTGRGKVSGDSVTNKYTQYALDTLDCYLSLEQLLTDAGYTITDDAPDIDLRELSKDSLMGLLMEDK